MEEDAVAWKGVPESMFPNVYAWPISAQWVETKWWFWKLDHRNSVRCEMKTSLLRQLQFYTEAVESKILKPRERYTHVHGI